MAKYQHVYTKIWSDSIFLEMSPEQKLVFLCILTNPKVTQCGIYEITINELGWHCGMRETNMQSAIEAFIGRYPNLVKYDDTTKEMAIINWPKYNLNTKSAAVKSAFISSLNEVKSIDLIKLIYTNMLGNQEFKELYIKKWQKLNGKRTANLRQGHDYVCNDQQINELRPTITETETETITLTEQKKYIYKEKNEIEIKDTIEDSFTINTDDYEEFKQPEEREIVKGFEFQPPYNYGSCKINILKPPKEEKEEVSAKKEKKDLPRQTMTFPNIRHTIDWQGVDKAADNSMTPNKTAQEVLSEDQLYFQQAYLMKFPKLRDDMDHILEQFSLACETDERGKSYYHPIDDLKHCRLSFLKWLNTWNRNEKNNPKKKQIDNSPSDFTNEEVDPGWD